MRRNVIAALVLAALGGSHTAALAYGPYAHLHLARQVAAKAGLDAQTTRYFTAGTLLADIDKSGRLVEMLKGHTALVKLIQGCQQVGPIERGVTHALTGDLVKKLLASTDAKMRAFGLGMRSHGLADQLADAKMKARRGHANSGAEDLAFDVVSARKLPDASAALDAVIASGILESPEISGWLAAALPGLPAAKITSQMKAYSCFVKNFVRNKAAFVGAGLELMIRAKYRLQCVKGFLEFGPSPCPPKKMWKDLLNTNLSVLPELVAPLLDNYKH